MSLQLLAHPLETIAANERSIARVAENRSQTRSVDHVVVGIPRQLGGKISAAATEALLLCGEIASDSPLSRCRLG